MIINALVYKSKKVKGFTAGGYEIGQIGTGKTAEKAMQDYLRAIESINEIRERGENINFFQTQVPTECVNGLEEIALKALNGNKTEPIAIKKLGELEVHFYKGREK